MVDIKSEYTVTFQTDAEGMFGRQCPNEECKRYFKIKGEDFSTIKDTIDAMYCPYCGSKDTHNHFFTEDQLEYAKSIVAQEITRAIVNDFKQYERHPDPDDWIGISMTVKADIPEIRNYVEKEVKRTVNCNMCNKPYSIYGVSYFCPFHGDRDPFTVFNENISSIRKTLEIEKVIGKEAHAKLVEEGMLSELIEKTLKDSVTAFETYCKNRYANKRVSITSGLAKDAVLKEVGNAFQNIDKGNKFMLRDFQFDYTAALQQNDLKQVKKCFAKRHVLTHSSGIIDAKYINETGENSNLTGTKVTVTEKEVTDLLISLEKIVSEIEIALK